MGQGSREHDLLEELIMILVTWSSFTGEKVENIGVSVRGDVLHIQGSREC